MTVNILLAALAVLGVLDVVTTRFALTEVKGTFEANGFMAKMMDRFGLGPVLAAKLVITAIALWCLHEYRGVQYVEVGLIAACAVYIYIVRNNAKVIGWI